MKKREYFSAQHSKRKLLLRGINAMCVCVSLILGRMYESLTPEYCGRKDGHFCCSSAMQSEIRSAVCMAAELGEPWLNGTVPPSDDSQQIAEISEPLQLPPPTPTPEQPPSIHAGARTLHTNLSRFLQPPSQSHSYLKTTQQKRHLKFYL